MSRTTNWFSTTCSWALGSRIGCAMPRKNQIEKPLFTFISHSFRAGYAPAAQLESAVGKMRLGAESAQCLEPRSTAALRRLKPGFHMLGQAFAWVRSAQKQFRSGVGE